MNLLDVPLWFALTFLFLLGTIVGSFLNVCIYRLPQHETLWPQLRSLSWPPSHCPGCKTNIPRWDNVPVLGWLKLGGRCRFCRIRISPRYPLIELGNGLLFVLIYWIEIPQIRPAEGTPLPLYSQYGPQIYDLFSAAVWRHWRFFYHLVLLEALVVATFIDFDKMIIPDSSTLPAMAVGVLGGCGLGQVYLVPLWFQKSNELAIWKYAVPEWLQPLLAGPDLPGWIAAHPHWHGLAVSVAGILVGGGLVWIIRIIGKWIMKREAMGFGDVVLMAMIGSFLGWQATLIVFFLAPFCALLFIVVALLTRRGGEIPYGPYLSIAALLLLVGWSSIWKRAEPIFELGIVIPALTIVMPILLAVCLVVIQLGKRLMGIPLVPAEFAEDWRSADQLSYRAGEWADDRQGSWRVDRWPGIDAGRGVHCENGWRNGKS
ncbi:MAG: prepilin peptidase [Planctomycetes bacterium]|nr:prepilin peptidase [Planctomycetota bacterium]